MQYKTCDNENEDEDEDAVDAAAAATAAEEAAVVDATAPPTEAPTTRVRRRVCVFRGDRGSFRGEAHVTVCVASQERRSRRVGSGLLRDEDF